MSAVVERPVTLADEATGHRPWAWICRDCECRSTKWWATRADAKAASLAHNREWHRDP